MTAGATPPTGYPSDRRADGRVAFVRPDFAAMLERSFRPVMRDGAGMAEVVTAIMGVLKELAEKVAPDYLPAFEAEARRVEGYGKEGLLLDADSEALARLPAELRETAAERRR